MTSAWLDVASPAFWGLTLSFWVAFTLTPKARLSWLWALANLTLVTLVTGPLGLLLSVGGVSLFYGLMRGVKHHAESSLKAASAATGSLSALWRARLARGALPLALLLTTALFVLHKTQWLTQGLTQGSASPSALKGLLLMVGFSYVSLRIIDLLRAVERAPERAPHLIDTLNYLLPFHMLTAGPIQSYDDFYAQHPSRQEELSAEGYVARWLEGGERIATGLVKKFCVAGLIQGVGLTDFSTTGWALFMEAQLFYVWLYFDFSAYSDIAVGIGKLCGLHTPENFNHPLSARNLTVFWERWHITLSQWIRAQLYTPVQLKLARLTGNRHPLLMSTVAFSVAFVLCGAWHELSPRFMWWGALHAGGLSIVNIYKHYLIKRWGRKVIRDRYMTNPWVRAIATLLTFEFVTLSLTFAFHPTLFP